MKLTHNKKNSDRHLITRAHNTLNLSGLDFLFTMLHHYNEKIQTKNSINRLNGKQTVLRALTQRICCDTIQQSLLFYILWEFLHSVVGVHFLDIVTRRSSLYYAVNHICDWKAIFVKSFSVISISDVNCVKSDYI